MSEHRQMPLELDRYGLEEVLVTWEEGADPRPTLQITLYGRNIIERALEPRIRVGDTVAEFPRIAPDERSISGLLLETPEEGSTIVLEFGGLPAAMLRQPFTRSQLRAEGSAP